jgi:hypothetical protein
MSTWLSIATGTTCLIVTIVGLILSLWAWRAKGARSGLRGIAWSLLPIAMYLTHAVGLVGRIGSAIVQFGEGFVFSPKAWLGVFLVGISVLLFLVSGGIPLFQSGKRKAARKARAGRDGGRGPGASPAAGPQVDRSPVPQAGPPPDDDLSDVQEILRRRGIK